MRKRKYFIIAILAFFAIAALIIFKVKDWNRQEIYVLVDKTDSFPFKIKLYDNEFLELSPVENVEGYRLDSKSSHSMITPDSLAQIFRQNSPLKITDYRIYIVQENLNGEKRTIPTNLVYVLID
ncbi:hypothetical protein [Flagellimonas marina]|uniref:Uncharacterized protein n=1 Tax=Flagellimonas marina TaxID=1775168 RepID=A0ABV8PS62_9FLAO